jgi:phosphatidylinositol glycan class O
VPQVDIVPTLSLLLGLPIPFSNLGSVIPDLFNHCPWWKTDVSRERQLYHAIQALHLNAHQVHDYLTAYKTISGELPLQEFERLDAIFKRTESELQSLMAALHHGHETHKAEGRLERLKDSYEAYLSGVKKMCEGVWAKFDLKYLVLGIVVAFCAVLVHIAMSAFGQSPFVLYTSLAVGSWVTIICVF